jgi:hypothetical protein
VVLVIPGFDFDMILNIGAVALSATSARSCLMSASTVALSPLIEGSPGCSQRGSLHRLCGDPGIG